MDLVTNLFKAYAVINDEPFKAYIRQIENAHDDGSAEIDGQTLLLKTVNFYKRAITKKEWEQPTDTQKEVLALKATIANLKKEAKTAKTTNTRSQMTDKGKGKVNQARTDMPAKPDRPNWLKDNLKPEKGSDLRKYRIWNGLKWYWCSPETDGKCDGHWRLHSPKDCKGMKKRPRTSKKKQISGQKRKASALKIAAANEALAAQAEMDEEEASDYEK
jgi:hypothetical protein